MRNSGSRSYSKYQAEQMISTLLGKKAIFAQAIVLFAWLCQALSYLSSQPWQGLSSNAVSVQKEKSWSKREDLEEH